MGRLILSPDEHHAQARPTGLGRYRAVCSCRWEHTDTRETRGMAEEDAAAHVIAEEECGVPVEVLHVDPSTVEGRERRPDLNPMGPNFAGLEGSDLRTWARVQAAGPGVYRLSRPLADRLIRVLQVARPEVRLASPEEARHALQAGTGRVVLSVGSGSTEDPLLVVWRDGDLIQSTAIAGWSAGVTEAVCDVGSEFLLEFLSDRPSQFDGSTTGATLALIEPDPSGDPWDLVR